MFPFRRTLSGIFCDIMPVKPQFRKTSPKLRFPENPFDITEPNGDQWKTCGDILKESELNLEEIVTEILSEL